VQETKEATVKRKANTCPDNGKQCRVDVRLQEYRRTVDDALDAQKELMEARCAAIEQAIVLARLQMDVRLESMNEFREQLREQASHFVSRGEYNVAHEGLTALVKSLEISRAEIGGKASTVNVFVGYVFTALALLTGMAGLIHSFMRGRP